VKKNLKFLISPTLIALAFSMPQKAQGAEDHDELVEKVYDPTVTYSAGIFNHHEDGATLSTHPQSPQKAWNQSLSHYDKKYQNYTQEAVLKLVIPGQDGRQRISNTTTWPYSIHVQLTAIFGSIVGYGSGSMVGPHHLLTCGHNVCTRGKGWAKEISVYPALNGKVAPFGCAKVTKAYTFQSWQSREDQQFDMALLLLDKPIGDYTGWGGLLNSTEAELSQERVTITGYPGDNGFPEDDVDKNCTQMWGMTHKIKRISSEQFYYEIDTYGGQSGSAVWVNKWGMPMILGVHTLGSNSINIGVRLSYKKFTEILRIISESYGLNSNIVPVPLVARGYEQVYQRFLNGRLIYKPNTNDNGKIELRIADLANPLGGTFDLSRCGDTGNYLSISTGYRKGKKPENANKVEIWFTPRFLVESEINRSASHLKKIFPINWPSKAAVGILWTWGGWDNLENYDYLTAQDMDELSNDNLYKKRYPNPLSMAAMNTHDYRYYRFRVHFEN